MKIKRPPSMRTANHAAEGPGGAPYPQTWPRVLVEGANRISPFHIIPMAYNAHALRGIIAGHVFRAMRQAGTVKKCRA